ncbi:MAG: four helix bundle protein [Candidatus Cloacimonetes bacterium]|nr:four helix bundle protein [Candidatus Cloacimonadota bacterium]
MAKENIVADKTFSFALKIITLYKDLSSNKQEYVLSKQILRSGTSIGANVSEATEAKSKADFVHKISIALKAARETEYWIRLLIGAEYISPSNPLKEDINEVIRILTAIIKTSKENPR